MEGTKIEDKDLYRVALDTRNLESTLFWQRCNYFLVLNSALALGFFNLILAGAIVLVALRRPDSRELALAGEIHHQALAAFEADLERSENDSPSSVRAALESAAIPALLPLIPLVIQRLRRHKGEKASEEAA